jgi:crotonobetainyl-CoA:carnitine CoA-transferase CaiB-like acyl-CoA transferase
MIDPTPSVLPAALGGLRVLDLSRVLAGPWCTQILGDLGADVAKIEMPGSGDDTRGMGPPFLPRMASDDDRAARESAYYVSCNRNKRSLAIDIASRDGAALIRRMAAAADIVVENFRVGALAKYGLDYASLNAISPRLVYCSITGFGQDGPYAGRGGFDLIGQAMGGFMSVTGEAGGGPLRAGISIADLSTGMYATISVLAALRHAEATGAGQHVDCSLLDSQIAMLANQGASYLVGGEQPPRMGNSHPTVVPYRPFDTQDGVLIVAAANDHQFQALCRVLGDAAMAADPRFARNAGRVEHRAQLEPLLEALIAARRTAELTEALVAAQVPAGPVNDLQQVFADPAVQARQTVRHFTRSDGVDIPVVAFPARFSETPVDYRMPPPRLGEHSAEVLRDWLGIGDDELGALVSGGVVAAP